MLVFQKDVKAVPVDLKDEGAGDLTENEGKLREWNVDALSPYSILLVVNNELSTTLSFAWIKVKEDIVKVSMIWSGNVDATNNLFS